MSSFVEIDGQEFKNVSTAARLTGYSRDYIGRLAREQKILATQIGRQWFVFVPSLQAYSQKSEQEQIIRQQKLSDERRQEREATKRIREKERAQVIAEQKKKFYSRTLAVTVLSLGVGLGITLNSISLSSLNSKEQLASAREVAALREAAREFPIATGEVVEDTRLDAIDFSKELMSLATLDASGKGVLLLPSGGSTELSEAEVERLFSDPVKIVKDRDGNNFVVRTAADGTEQQIPFAVVPVTNSATP
ncbi:MAG: hypothetical protein AAB618_02220 [Patescibacteria group bacterium]